MGLFGKKKSSEQILAEGRVQYENGNLKKAFLTLHGLAGKGEPHACYYVGKIYLERKEKNLAQSFLTTAVKGGVQDAASLLAKEFGVRNYLPKEEVTAQPELAPAPRPKADEAPSVDDLLEELEETGKLIQDTKREQRQTEKKMGVLGEISRPKPQTDAQRPAPPTPSAPAPAPDKKRESAPAAPPAPAPVTQAVPAKNPVSAPAEKPETEFSPEEKYQKGMELFKAGRYEEAYKFLDAVCDIFYFSRQKAENIYPAGQAALGWMCETGNGTKLDATAASMYYGNAIDNATGVPDRDGMAGMVRLTAKSENPSLEACETALGYARRLGTAEAKAAVPALEKKLDKAQRHEKIDAMIRDYDRLSAAEKDCLADKWLSMTMPQKFAFKKALGEALEKQAGCIDDLETQRKIKEIAYECQHYKERYEFAMNNFKGVSNRKEQIQWIEELFGRPLSSEELKATNLENLFREAFFWRG